MLALVISMQGWGMLGSGVISLIALSAGVSLEALWRLLLALGALPSLLAFVIRWQLHESSAYRKACSAVGMQSEASRPALFRKLWPRLVGTSVSWFLMNISLYSLGSFKSMVLHDSMDLTDRSARRRVYLTSSCAACTSCFAIAGFTAALVLINRLGRYWMQLMGFSALATLFAVQAILSAESIKPPTSIYVILLGLVFFFQNLGPNTTTFVIPAEAFPTLIRATCHGVSAASGKVGAFTGTMLFPAAEARWGMMPVYIGCAITAALGAWATYALTPRSVADADSVTD